MVFENLPQDEGGRVIALNAMKSALLELAEVFEFDLVVHPTVTGTIHNEIELIERCLNFGVDYVKGEQ